MIFFFDQGHKFNYEVYQMLSSLLGFEQRLELPIFSGMKLG